MRLRLWNSLKRKLKPQTTKGLIGLITGGAVAVIVIGGGAYAAIFGGFNGAGQNSTINLQKGLVGWWQLNGNAQDSSPYRNNGTVTAATPTTDREGQANKAYSFNGTTSNIQVPDVPVLRSWTNGTTVSVWAKSNTSTWNDYGFLVSKRDSFIIHPNQGGNSLNFYFNIVGIGYTSVGTSGPTDITKWHLYTMTYNNSNIVGYIDGVQVGSTPATGGIASDSGPTFFGQDDGIARYLNGSLDDVRIYNRPISAAEVTALYKEYDAQVNAGTGENGLIGWWKMDGNTLDSSPYRNNGIVTGATLTSDRKGAASSAYSFNGSSSYISTTGQFSVPTNTVSVSAWIYLNNLTTNGMIVEKEPVNSQWELFVESSNLRWIGGSGYNASVFCSGMTAGVWHHVVGVQTGTTATLYRDGTQCGTATQPAITNGAGGLAIGRYNNGYYFNGAIDDVRVYNRALSVGEIATQYKSYNSQINLNSSPTNQGTLNLNSGLAGYWNFNGNAVDSTPYRNNGTVTGAGLTTDRKGRPNSAYSFNGSSSYISMPTMSISNAVTVSAWVYSTNYNQNGFIVGKNPVNTQWELFFEGPTLKWRGGAPYTNNSCSLPGNNAWHHVVGMQNGTVVTIYIDGVQCATGTNTVIGNGSGTVEVGRFSSAYYFNGTIDDVRIYNRALTAAEVTALYNNYY